MASAKPAGDDRDPGLFAPKSYLFRDYLPSRYSGKGSFEVRSKEQPGSDLRTVQWFRRS